MSPPSGRHVAWCVSHWRFFGHFWRHSSVKRESICAHWNGQRQSRRKRGVSSQRIYLNVCDENYRTLSFDDKIILRHTNDVRPASLSLEFSLISSFAYEILAWLTRLLLILSHLWWEGMRLLRLFLQMYTRRRLVKDIRHAFSCC